MHVAVDGRMGGRMQTTRMDLILEGGFNSLHSTARGSGLVWCVLLFWEPPLLKILNRAIKIRNKGKGMRICSSGPNLGSPGLQYFSNQDLWGFSRLVLIPAAFSAVAIGGPVSFSSG